MQKLSIKQIMLLSTVCCLAFVGSSAYADDDSNLYYLVNSGKATYNYNVEFENAAAATSIASGTPLENTLASDTTVWNLGLGYELTSFLNVEARYRRIRDRAWEARTAGSVALATQVNDGFLSNQNNSLQLLAKFNFSPAHNVMPYVLLGANKYEGNGGPGGVFGLGLNLFGNDSTAINIEASGVYSIGEQKLQAGVMKETLTDSAIMVGFQHYFGGRK